MRITIGRKIFAVACILLLLMLCSAVLSTWKLRQASSEADAVAHYFMPLANRISNVQALLLQQKILVQPVLHEFDAPNVHDQSIDEHLGEFEGYGAPVDEEIAEAGNEARLACRAALAQFDQLDMLRQRLPDVTGLRRDLPEVHIRVGLASGDALVGSIGSDYARNFTVMGDTVNLGSRLEGATGGRLGWGLAAKRER